MSDGSLESLSAFRKGPDSRLMGADDRFGSGGDCDVVKILQIWMTGIENWIFEADT